jgi:hypothetical protein
MVKGQVSMAANAAWIAAWGAGYAAFTCLLCISLLTSVECHNRRPKMCLANANRLVKCLKRSFGLENIFRKRNFDAIVKTTGWFVLTLADALELLCRASLLFVSTVPEAYFCCTLLLCRRATC